MNARTDAGIGNTVPLSISESRLVGLDNIRHPTHMARTIDDKWVSIEGSFVVFEDGSIRPLSEVVLKMDVISGVKSNL